jgi:predicted metal-dependent phosphoesterase TrpH
MREKGYMPVDMHIHTHYSDAAIRIPSLLTRANHLGIGVAITDHNEIGFFLSTNTIVITKKISAINNIGNRK